jgi:hypothetical protein
MECRYTEKAADGKKFKQAVNKTPIGAVLNCTFGVLKVYIILLDHFADFLHFTVIIYRIFGRRIIELPLKWGILLRPCLKNGEICKNHDSSKVSKSQKRSIQFVISCGDSSEPFNLLEKAFNQMTLFVKHPIAAHGFFVLAFGGMVYSLS